jgi:hypothetical protein
MRLKIYARRRSISKERYRGYKTVNDMEPEERNFIRFMLTVCFLAVVGAVTCYLNTKLEAETKVKIVEIEKAKNESGKR